MHPVPQHGAGEISLPEIVEAEDALIVGLRGAREGMQPATAGMAQNRVHLGKFAESGVHCRLYLGRTRDVSRKVNIRRRADLPLIESLLGLFRILYVGENQLGAGFSEPADHMFSNRAQSAGDQNCFAGKINADHVRLLPSVRESISCPDSVTSTLSSIRAP